MNYNKKTINDVDVAGKKVLLRCDFNVPQDKVTGEITSDKRIKAALPTIRQLLDNGAAVIACSHLGKPVATFESYVKKQVEKGKNEADITRESWEKSLRKLTLAPVAKRLSELLGMDVIFASDTIGPDAQAKAAALQPGQILLLENLRFDKGETKNDPAFAKALADMADIFVSDAFGTVHRAHASTAGVAAYLPAYSGLLVAKEIAVMGKALENPVRPFVAILGGAKVSDKIAVINNLLEKADTIIIGGGMAYTFKKARVIDISSDNLASEVVTSRVVLNKSYTEKPVCTFSLLYDSALVALEHLHIEVLVLVVADMRVSPEIGQLLVAVRPYSSGHSLLTNSRRID